MPDTASFASPVSLLFRYFNFQPLINCHFGQSWSQKCPKILSISVYPHYKLSCLAAEVSLLLLNFVVFAFVVKISFTDLPLTAAFAVVNFPCDYTFLQ